MKKYIALASIVTTLALAFSNYLASWFITYQPQTPDCLK
jgi:cyclic lactone autoinducer peptide